MNLKIVLLIVMISISGKASSSFQSGQGLLHDCDINGNIEQGIKHSEVITLMGQCSSYFQGIIDTYLWFDYKKPHFCLPDKVNAIQLSNIFVEFAKPISGAKVMMSNAVDTVVVALMMKFPCS